MTALKFISQGLRSRAPCDWSPKWQARWMSTAESHAKRVVKSPKFSSRHHYISVAPNDKWVTPLQKSNLRDAVLACTARKTL